MSKEAVEPFQRSSQKTSRFLIPELQRQEGDSVRISSAWNYTSVYVKDTDLKRRPSYMSCHHLRVACHSAIFEISVGLIHVFVI